MDDRRPTLPSASASCVINSGLSALSTFGRLSGRCRRGRRSSDRIERLRWCHRLCFAASLRSRRRSVMSRPFVSGECAAPVCPGPRPSASVAHMIRDDVAHQGRAVQAPRPGDEPHAMAQRRGRNVIDRQVRADAFLVFLQVRREHLAGGEFHVMRHRPRRVHVMHDTPSNAGHMSSVTVIETSAELPTVSEGFIAPAVYPTPLAASRTHDGASSTELATAQQSSYHAADGRESPQIDGEDEEARREPQRACGGATARPALPRCAAGPSRKRRPAGH